jgi:hypothetical protein
METMLLNSGFLPENINLFFANGGTPGGQYRSTSSKPKFLPSAMKTGLRGHLRTICESRHCADSLFIYLNNPTTVDGDMLLWDLDHNGIVSLGGRLTGSPLQPSKRILNATNFCFYYYF